MRLVALAALAAAAITSPALAEPVVTLAPGEALLSVKSEGRVLSRPDLMTLRAGTVTTGATAEEAVAANAALAQRMLQAVRDAGITPRDIRTENFRVRPEFEGGRDRYELNSQGRPPRILGYVAENHVSITMRDLNRAEELITRLFDAGANSVTGPHFGLSDNRTAIRAAERAAIAEARAAAENQASAASRRIGRLIRISHRQSWTDPNFEGMITVTGSGNPPTPIEPGEIATEVELWVDYALAPQ